MRYIFSLLCLFLWVTNSQGQINKGKKYYSKGEYEAAIKAFENDLEKETSLPVSLEYLGKIHFDKNYEGYNLDKAYKYTERAIEEFKALTAKDRKKLQKKKVSSIAMSKTLQDIIVTAYQKAKKENTVQTSNHFLELYTEANKQQIKRTHQQRNKLALAQAQKKYTHEAYVKLFKKYEISFMEYSPVLYKEAQKGLLETYIYEKGWAMYPAFEDKYPDNIYVRDQEAAYALIKIYRKKDLKLLQTYMESYPHTPFVKFTKAYMYAIIIEDTELEDYDYFVRQHPNYEDEGKLWKRFYDLYRQEYGQQSVVEFAETYPNYPFKKQLKKDLEKALYERQKPIFKKAKESEEALQMMAFIERYPSSRFVKELEQPFAEAIQQTPLFRTAAFFVQTYPKSDYYNDILDVLYEQYTRDGELASINQFMVDYPEYRNVEKLTEDLRIAKQGAKLNLTATFDESRRSDFNYYIQKAAPNERAFVALLRMIEQDIINKNWVAAIAQVKHQSKHFGDYPKIKQLLQLLQQQAPPIPKKSLGDKINTRTDEYVPIISVNDQLLYFCRWDKHNENIYVAKKENGQWGAPTFVKGLNKDEPLENEGPLAISADNSQIIVFKNGDLFAAERKNNGWYPPKAFSPTINTKAWEADAMISSDGKALLFSSKRKEILDLDVINTKGYHGDGAGNADLFVSIKGIDGEWQSPINLGDVINTPYLERSPFLHPDMKTLYFSSDGHAGFGRMDVFKTTRLDDSWTNWSKPVNLGKAINTPQNDWGYKVSTDGEKAYFAFQQDEMQGQDLFQITLPSELRPEAVSIITGKLTDSDNQPVNAQIVWEDLESGKEIGRLQNDPKDGSFYIALPNHKKYSYYIDKAGYFPKANHIDLKKKNQRIVVKEALSMVKISEMIDQGLALPLKNLFFEAGKYKIQPSSYLELNRLAKIIQKYNLKVEIAGHTDDNGSAKDNLILSQNRAKAVKDYLVQQGCAASVIQAKGFGEDKPVASNKTDAGKQQNRRVEVRFTR